MIAQTYCKLFTPFYGKTVIFKIKFTIVNYYTKSVVLDYIVKYLF